MAHYYEFIIHGDDRELTAYLTGYGAAGGVGRVLFAEESGFKVKGLRERLKHHGEVRHVICDASHRSRVHAALEAAAPRYQFEIKEERKIERAYFHFEFETPSRKVADRIKKVFAGLPTGVVVTDYAPEEIIDPKATSAELYSPEHEYVFRGEGVIEGDVFGVIDARATLCDIEFTSCDEIEVHHTV